MKHLLFVIGFRTPHRNSAPTVLASGIDRAALQNTVDASAADFQRFELGAFTFMRKMLRRDGATPATPAEPIGEGPEGAPTMEEGLALLERIDQLEAKNESYGRQLAEFEQVKVDYVTEIERLKTEKVEEIGKLIASLEMERTGRIDDTATLEAMFDAEKKALLEQIAGLRAKAQNSNPDAPRPAETADTTAASVNPAPESSAPAEPTTDAEALARGGDGPQLIAPTEGKGKKKS